MFHHGLRLNSTECNAAISPKSNGVHYFLPRQLTQPLSRQSKCFKEGVQKLRNYRYLNNIMHLTQKKKKKKKKDWVLFNSDKQLHITARGGKRQQGFLITLDFPTQAMQDPGILPWSRVTYNLNLFMWFPIFILQNHGFPTPVLKISQTNILNKPKLASKHFPNSCYTEHLTASKEITDWSSLVLQNPGLPTLFPKRTQYTTTLSCESTLTVNKLKFGVTQLQNNIFTLSYYKR